MPMSNTIKVGLFLILICFNFLSFKSYSQKAGVDIAESVDAMEIQQARNKIEELITGNVRLIGFARGLDGYVLNLESDNTKSIADLFRRIDQLPKFGSPRLVEYDEYQKPFVVTVIVPRLNVEK